MIASLRVAVADDEPDIRAYFQRILTHLGHQVVAVADNGRTLVEECRRTQPDLVITDIKMPELDGIDAALQIYHERPVPIILVSAHNEPELIERAEADHVMGYLVKPIKQADLPPMMTLALRRIEQFQALQHETTDLRQALRERRLVERAVEVVVRRAGVAEAEALARLRRLAADRQRKLAEVADAVLLAADVLPPTEPA